MTGSASFIQTEQPVNGQPVETTIKTTFTNKTGYPLLINTQTIANSTSYIYQATVPGIAPNGPTAYKNLQISIPVTIPSTGLQNGGIIYNASNQNYQLIAPASTGTNFINSTPFIITFSTTDTGKAASVIIQPKKSISLKNAITGVVSLDYADAIKKELNNISPTGSSSVTNSYSIIVGPKGGLHFQKQK